MPNIGALLREEISRLSRKEVRSQITTTRKASAQYRRHIASLKRQVAKLERQVALLTAKVLNARPAAGAEPEGKRLRFVRKGLRAQRERLGLSATDYAKLVGVSSQSIYNWERGVASPRAEQVATLASLRGMSKREAQARLAQAQASHARKARKS
jgi:DNA-binding XRE family transcriptional regulator